MPKLRKWIEERLEGATLNMFGGLVQLTNPPYPVVHNDLDPSIPADLHRDACDLKQWLDDEGEYQTVVFDPPYTAYQTVKYYGVKKKQEVNHARDVVEHVLVPGGRVISLGYNSTGMSRQRGFEIEEVLLVNCGASHNDYIVTVDRRI